MTTSLLNSLLRALLRWGAALVFCLPLRHRPHFWARACGMLLPLLLLAQLLDPLAQSTTLWQQQLLLLVLYVSFFALLGGMIYLCTDINKKGALYCAVWSLLIAQCAYESWCFLELQFTRYGHPLNMASPWAVLVQLPDELLVQLKKHFIGMLLVGEPDSGKTTLLRQIARELAGMQRRACVVDERCEIFPPGDSEKMPPLDLLSGIPKERAVQMALRTLSPQVILLDELGTLAETAALEQGFYSGVDFVASVHAASVEEAARRPQVQALQRHGMLRVFVLLHGCTAPGKVRQVCTV